MFKHIYICLLLSLCCTVGSSQPEIIDSLELLYARAIDTKTRVDLLLEISTAYQEYDYPKSIASGYDALALARSIDYKEGIFYAYNNLGVAFNGIGPIDSAHYYHQASMDLAIELNDPHCLAMANSNLGIY